MDTARHPDEERDNAPGFQGIAMRLIALLLLAFAVPCLASAQRGPDRVLRTETATGTLRAWEFGDYLWARIEIEGRGRSGMRIGEGPIGPFLEAHRGRPLTLTLQLASVYIPEAGGRDIVTRIVGARLGALTARTWWRRLTPTQRGAARTRFERAIQ
jgi:hypothetical protein